MEHSGYGRIIEHTIYRRLQPTATLLRNRKPYKNEKTMTTFYQQFQSPAGLIHIVANDTHLKAITFSSSWEQVQKSVSDIKNESNAITDNTRIQLLEYFAGTRRDFDLPIALHGTEFQKRAWHALLTIPYGETRSYSEQAILIGNPNAVRAVGRTNGLNPIGIVVPCHRVIGKSGKLTGYAAGLEVKRFLLNLERAR